MMMPTDTDAAAGLELSPRIRSAGHRRVLHLNPDEPLQAQPETSSGMHDHHQDTLTNTTAQHRAR